jgi:hypothetical protein
MLKANAIESSQPGFYLLHRGWHSVEAGFYLMRFDLSFSDISNASGGGRGSSTSLSEIEESSPLSETAPVCFVDFSYNTALPLNGGVKALLPCCTLTTPVSVVEAVFELNHS